MKTNSCLSSETSGLEPRLRRPRKLFLFALQSAALVFLGATASRAQTNVIYAINTLFNGTAAPSPIKPWAAAAFVNSGPGVNGTGRVNVGQGAVMTAQGVGAALSPAIGGWLAQVLGYPAAFIILGCFAIGSIVIWLSFSALLKPACAGKPADEGAMPVLAA